MEARMVKRPGSPAMSDPPVSSMQVLLILSWSIAALLGGFALGLVVPNAFGEESASATFYDLPRQEPLTLLTETKQGGQHVFVIGDGTDAWAIKDDGTVTIPQTEQFKLLVGNGELVAIPVPAEQTE